MTVFLDWMKHQGMLDNKELSSSSSVSFTTCELNVVVVGVEKANDALTLFATMLTFSTTMQTFSTCLLSSNIATTLDILGRFAGICCTQTSPIFITCIISSIILSNIMFGSTRCHNSLDWYIFHACTHPSTIKLRHFKNQQIL